MIVRSRRHVVVQTLALYAGAACFIGYFAFHAYHGDHGMKAKQQYLAEIAELRAELANLKQERLEIDRRVGLLRADAIDPDMLDQRAREMLNFVDARDLVFVEPRR